jgi:hypothetical protein
MAFTIQRGGKTTPYPTLESATKAAREIFEKTGVVVGIEKA